MNNKIGITFVISLFALTFSDDSFADDQRFRFGFDASAAVEHDSNVAIIDLDANSGEADTATVLDAGLDLRISLSKKASLTVAYDYSGTSYREYSEFDLELHHAMAEAAVQTRYVDLAVGADRFEGILDGENYLTLTRVSPSIARLFGNRVYARAAYIETEKEYDQYESRNAESDAIRLDTYVLFDGMDRYLSLGVQTSSEDALDAQLDFDGVQAMLGYGHTFKLPLMQLQLKAQLRYEDRDYLNVTESIGEPRSDQRWRSSLTATIPFTDHVKLEASVEHSDNESNLDSAVLDKVVYGLGLNLQF